MEFLKSRIPLLNTRNGGALEKRLGQLPLVNSLEEYCDGQSITPTTIHPGAVQHRRPSHTIADQLAELLVSGPKIVGKNPTSWKAIRYARLHAGEYYPVNPVLLCEIPDAWLYTRSGIVISREGIVLGDSTPTFDHFKNPPASASMEQAPSIPGLCLPIMTLWDSNYAHWLMDSLPRLMAIPYLPPDTKILVKPNLQTFQRESLELLGVSPSQIHEIDAPFVRVEKLAVFRSANASGVPHFDVLSTLRKNLLESAGEKNSPSSSKIFISRSQTPSRSRSQRRILNQDQVMALLQKEGFETAHPEKLTFPDQIRLFSKASVIAGAHGAGIYNLLFAPSATPILEFYTHSWWDHAACRISSLFEMPHFHLFSSSTDQADNFSVAIADLDKILADVLPGDSHSRAAEALF